MKRILILTSILAILLLPSFAQDNNGRGGRLEALKIAYLTRKMDLSPEEAQKFWPIYNNYSTEIKNIRIEQKTNKVSELDTEDKILSVRKKYSAEFSKVLSADKVNTFFRSEREFGNYVQKELLERRQQRQNQQGNP